MMSDLENILQDEWASMTKNLDPKNANIYALYGVAFNLACKQKITEYDLHKVIDWWKRVSEYGVMIRSERRRLLSFVRFGEMAKKNRAIPLVWEQMEREVFGKDAEFERSLDAMLRQLDRNPEASQEALIAAAEEALVPPRGWFRLHKLFD
jgi:hypothetical protein